MTGPRSIVFVKSSGIQAHGNTPGRISRRIRAVLNQERAEEGLQTGRRDIVDRHQGVYILNWGSDSFGIRSGRKGRCERTILRFIL